MGAPRQSHVDAFKALGDRVQPMPPVTSAQLERLEAQLGGQPAADFAELLTVASGFRVGAWTVRFTGPDDDLEALSFPEICPAGVTLAKDPSGNYWVADVHDGAPGLVLYFCHDPPVATVAARSFPEFMRRAAEGPAFLEASVRAADEAWEGAERLAADRLALANDRDPVVQRFLDENPGGIIVDLRSVDGLPWGLYGSDPVIRRAGALPVFWLGKPARQRSHWRLW